MSRKWFAVLLTEQSCPTVQVEGGDISRQATKSQQTPGLFSVPSQMAGQRRSCHLAPILQTCECPRKGTAGLFSARPLGRVPVILVPINFIADTSL